ncbi:uncharacterized protein si:ch73-100l22.3 isoform X2 [Melanotaenia boesemani]|nr:uncharacterized protein si:ch73-100l22.3 isoform X2 [Melanotaenia boesemani]
MQRHRDEAQKAAIHKKFTDDPRMAYVQTILQSIQLRKTPTLEELLQESEIKTESSHQHNTSSGSVSHSNVFVRSEESLSPTPTGKLKTGISLPPMTSTTYSAFFASNVTPEQSYLEGCLTNQHDSHKVSQPCSCNAASHQSLSSGYVTYENVENTATISGGIEPESFCPSEEVYTVDGFFLHSTSNTIAKMPDIISHPPIDGDELERGGLESFCGNLMGVGGPCDTSFQDDSVILDHLQAEKSHNSMEQEEEIPFNAILDSAKDINEGSLPVSEKSDFSDNPESSQTLSTPHCPTTELHVQQNPGEPEPVDSQVDEIETKTSEEPFPLSLQALLKKSQEYRRRQRMVRNQAKHAKIQERNQEQPSARAEEQSLSDKENDEFLYKGTVTAVGKKTKERRGTFVPSVETSTQKSENEEMNESEVSWKKTDLQTESTCVAGEGNVKELIVEEETILKNNKLNSFQEVVLKPKQRISPFIQQQPTSRETCLAQDAFYETTLYTRVGKYRTFPAPNFCRSPIHCKSKGFREGEAVEIAETSEGKLISPDVTEDKSEEVTLINQNTKSSHRSLPSSVTIVVDGDVTSVLAKSSQHIDQLESNLSSLKILISDLESTVKENLDNHCQTDSNMQSESSFKSIRQSEEIKADHSAQLGPNDYLDCWEEKQGEAECREWLRRHSFINFENINAHLGPESNIRNTEDFPFTDQEREAEMVKLSEIRLDRISATQREKEREVHKEGLTQSFLQNGSCKRQQLPVKSILSVAQQLRIPNIFRNVPSDNRVPCHLTGLSDTSNHPVERQSMMTVEGQSSVLLPSLNQSYDVDTPSGLWLLEGMGPRSELGSQSHLGQEKHLTPDSEGEDQTGKFRVKRRLIMHMTEETQEGNDVSRGVDPMGRPSSTTPRATAHWYKSHGNQKERQEKLKQTHAAQLRALQNEHRKQQEELLQALAVRYSLLHNLSFPCSMSGSHLGETSTFSTLSQPLSPLSQHYRPLLSAVVKGFLTRRLLRTERVVQLVRTIRDTQQFLQALQQQSTIKGEFCSRQDVFLQERVTLQLRAARYEVYDIFFSLSAGERMRLISWDRELVRERELRRQNGHTDPPRGKSSLSAATQKSLERKRGMMIQKKAAPGNRGVVMRTGQKSGLSAEKLQEMKRGQFRANPQRVPKSACFSRPR